MSRRGAPLACLLLAALGASACDWTDFDDLQLKTPVRALARPDDMDSNRYPAFVLPVTKPRGNAELLVIGTDNLALADFSFGPDGDPGTQTVSNDRFLLGGAKVGPLAVAAYLLGTDDVPRIAAVTDEELQPILITLDSTNANFSVVALGSALAVNASALATGNARGTGESDIVIASGTKLLTMPNAAAAATESCDLGYVVSALAVGEGWVVAGQSAEPGHAWLVPQPNAGAGADCTDVLPFDGHAEAAGFGTAVAVADADGDGLRDLVAVAAPAVLTVYTYASADVAAPMDEYTVAGGSTACGTAIAVGKVEGQNTLVIGDPGDPGDVTAPGAVWMVNLETGEFLPKLERPTEDVQRFGTQVGVLSFTGTAGPVDLLWVTAESVTAGDPGVVYLYYWVHVPDSDPRKL